MGWFRKKKNSKDQQVMYDPGAAPKAMLIAMAQDDGTRALISVDAHGFRDCEGNVVAALYKAIIQSAPRFLSGGPEHVIERLCKESIETFAETRVEEEDNKE